MVKHPVLFSLSDFPNRNWLIHLFALPVFGIYLLSPHRCSLVSNNACLRCTPPGVYLSCEVCMSPLMRVCVHHESRVYQGWEGWGVMEQARSPAAGGSVQCLETTVVEWMGSFHSETELSDRPETCTTCRWHEKSCKITYAFWKFRLVSTLRLRHGRDPNQCS